MKNPSILLIFAFYAHYALGNKILTTGKDMEDQRIDLMIDLISHNLKTNGWNNILCLGHLPDYFYAKIKKIPYTFTITNTENEDHDVEDPVLYKSNIIVINCLNFDEFEDALIKGTGLPYWHAHSNIILYYHAQTQDDIANIFFIFWYYRACNAIIVQYDDSKESLILSYYNPYISENYELQNCFGCWKTTKLGRQIIKFRDSFKCEEGCLNVSLHSQLRANHLGTCIGFDTHIVQYSDKKSLRKLNLFEDKGKNLHGYVLRAQVFEVLPFMEIREHSDGTYTLHSRDGEIWTAFSKLMDFEIDLTPSKDIMKQQFNFEIVIQQIFSFSLRQTDLLLGPVYQFDLVFVEVDMSIAFKDSGVCFLSHRADFETILFDVKLMGDNYMLLIRYLLCFLFIWFFLFIFYSLDRGRFTFDQAGKDFINTIKNVLSISLQKIPNRISFRIYLGVTIWSFFVINFATQAAIISFFTAFKRGKEVDTFEDVLQKGYVIEGMASPDMMLPDTEERFVKINSRLVPVLDLFGCVKEMSNDSRRFCLIDCSVGRYLERNRLNEKGHQYLHIATKDRIHSHYLNMIFHKFSPMTDTFNRYLRIFVEAGLVKKWESYRFNDIKEEGTIKALTLEDLIGIFKIFYILIGLSFAVFVLEVAAGVLKRIKRYLRMKFSIWKRVRLVKKRLQLERKLGKIKKVNASTQTLP